MDLKHAKIILLILISAGLLFGQKPIRVGTTTANFLEIGMGSAASAMGDAYVGVARDVGAIYWNVAGLAYTTHNQAQFTYQPWFVDTYTMFAGIAVSFPVIGTLALSTTQMSYGDIEVTNMTYQEGTGEIYSANEYTVGISYARKLAQWFAFGATGKMIGSRIWHLKATAYALDLGVMVNTYFFSTTGNREDGLNIGMSISNYGTRMRYEGIDLLNPIDILPDENGNYADVAGQFRLQSWELPLIFRIGVAVKPIAGSFQNLILSAEALHPNNNSESVNVGAQYELRIPGMGSFFLRGGYKALFMNRSEYGLTFGGGLNLTFLGNQAIQIDYAYKTMGIIGNAHSYTAGVQF